MVIKVSRMDRLSFFLLKVAFYYAKAFSMLHFSLRMDGKPRLVHSKNTKLLAIGCRIVFLVVHSAYLPGVLEKVNHMSTGKRSVENYVLVVIFIQFVSIAMFSIALITFHVVRNKQTGQVVNRVMNVCVRISRLTKNKPMFRIDFCLTVIIRLLFHGYVNVMNLHLLYNEIVNAQFMVALERIAEHYLWVGTLVVVEMCFIAYVSFSTMYKNITDYMLEFQGRLEGANPQTLSKSRQRLMFADFSKHLEECTLICTELFEVFNDFHKIFQFHIIFTFYIDFVTLFVLVHYSFWTYIVKGHLLVESLFFGFIKAMDILWLVSMADRVLRRSKILKCFNWDNMCSDVDKRWDRTVDQFLNVLRFQEVKIEIYGLFRLNNELCLRALSVFVAYLTIIFQFRLLGYFRKDDYVFTRE